MDVSVGVLEGSVVGLSGLGGVLGARGAFWERLEGSGKRFGWSRETSGSVSGSFGRQWEATWGPEGARESKKKLYSGMVVPLLTKRGSQRSAQGRQREAQGSQETPKRAPERTLDATRGESENVPKPY